MNTIDKLYLLLVQYKTEAYNNPGSPKAKELTHQFETLIYENFRDEISSIVFTVEVNKKQYFANGLHFSEDNACRLMITIGQLETDKSDKQTVFFDAWAPLAIETMQNTIAKVESQIRQEKEAKKAKEELAWYEKEIKAAEKRKKTKK